jgi:hypothetical protein
MRRYVRVAEPFEGNALAANELEGWSLNQEVGGSNRSGRATYKDMFYQGSTGVRSR